MSKEKQCECCHEWWYASDIKEDLCPNCYDYFKQLKRQLKEKDKEVEMLKHTLNLYNLRHKGSVLPNINQLAIQELEKVKIMAGDLLEKFCSSWEYHQKYMRGHRHIEYYDLIQGIDNQIKELKGE